VAVTSMSRRALSYSIDNLLATTPSTRCDADRQPTSAAFRLHSVSEQRMLIKHHHYYYRQRCIIILATRDKTVEINSILNF